ncbi:MAG: alpha/beta hydrolase [Acidobacteriota bacterium]|nr:alpha/beta hydrolase [Acidobacteriota bacterium]MDQ2843424.1 alpha/beta hydrolase [Acidobacteriota bacterium]
MGFCRIATLWIIGSLVGAALAQEAVPNAPPSQSEISVLGIATYPLWPGGAPDARGTGDGDVPLLTEFRPQPRTGNGTVVIIAPGGAYLGLASNLEGRQVADWYASRGITAFVLRYRLGSQYLYPIPLQDAQRAIRFVRSQAKAFGLVPDRIGIMGFSAGGHLAAMTATMSDSGKAESPDVIDRASSRPDFVVLGYPWLNAMQKNETGVLSYCSALKISAERCSNFEQYSPDQHISAQTPPTFIYHTTDDELVPVEASLRYYKALRTAGLPVEMHLFEHGRHGSGLGLGDASLDLWPTLLESWLRSRGLLTSGDAATASKHN